MRPRRTDSPRFCCALVLSLLAGAIFAAAQSAGASITLQPVPPKTVPPSDYPPGTTIVGQEIILGSVPARVWLEIHATGFPTTGSPNCLKTIHATVDSYDNDFDGGGYAGSAADCGGQPANGGDLTNAVQSCTGNGGNYFAAQAAATAVCRQTMSGRTGPCATGEPLGCNEDSDPSPGTFTGVCSYFFLDTCDSEWVCAGFTCLASGDVDFNSLGATVYDADRCMKDFAPSYVGTFVLEVPANAKGSYTIDFNESATFMLNGNPPPNHIIPIEVFNPAIITVPCGRCCYGVNTGTTGCVEGVSAMECATNAPSAVFQANMDCPDSGGPACPVCALDEHCDDGLFCNGPEVCEASGVCGPGQAPCGPLEACEESTDHCAPRIPTTSFWGMIMLAFMFLIAAKLRYRRLPHSTFALILTAGLFSFPSNTLAQSGASIILQPVPPKTVPPSDYPPGTTIVGQEIILGSVPARVWLEVQVTGFPTDDYPNCARTVQARIDAMDVEGDGGGYFGANADCLGTPANGGDLTNAVQTCTGNGANHAAAQAAATAVCRQTMSGRTSNCATGEPLACGSDTDPSAGTFSGNCSYIFLDTCDSEWICAGIACIPATELSTVNPRVGAAVNADPGICMKDFSPSYLATLILDIPANAKGSYTVDFGQTETFLLNGNPAPNNLIPIEKLNPAIITIPCGSCCSGYSTATLECVDHVVESDCAGSVDQVFTADQLCPANGGTCPQCASDADCDDGIACTVDQCQSDHSCQNSPTQASCDDGLFCNGPEICDPPSGCIAGPIPCDFRLCDEDADLCRAGIPTVSNWGLVILIIALLVAAKLRYRRMDMTRSSFP